MNYAVEIDRAIDDDQLASALALAERWVAEAPDEDIGAIKNRGHLP